MKAKLLLLSIIPVLFGCAGPASSGSDDVVISSNQEENGKAIKFAEDKAIAMTEFDGNVEAVIKTSYQTFTSIDGLDNVSFALVGDFKDAEFSCKYAVNFPEVSGVNEHPYSIVGDKCTIERYNVKNSRYYICFAAKFGQINYYAGFSYGAEVADVSVLDSLIIKADSIQSIKGYTAARYSGSTEVPAKEVIKNDSDTKAKYEHLFDGCSLIKSSEGLAPGDNICTFTITKTDASEVTFMTGGANDIGVNGNFYKIAAPNLEGFLSLFA